MENTRRRKAVELIDTALARLAKTHASIGARDAAVRMAIASVEEAEAAIIIAQGNLELIAELTISPTPEALRVSGR